jgi:hypothetical protein
MSMQAQEGLEGSAAEDCDLIIAALASGVDVRFVSCEREHAPIPDAQEVRERWDNGDALARERVGWGRERKVRGGRRVDASEVR